MESHRHQHTASDTSIVHIQSTDPDMQIMELSRPADGTSRITELVGTVIHPLSRLSPSALPDGSAQPYVAKMADRKDPTRPGHVLAPVLENARTLGHPSLH
ncbi:hypothetical protein PENNAL_c0069G05831 [Penicillium nalgiovense]|uniref:Uncharacterized protein n=1 Tax=Penicillium nalgiovense TaxID=60175 RepID=A0A1V6XM42_PENNA|nr:hypothetical protein PENNAL_c0069G05831 [Penicillium nalgiovense]